jgi:uncharacterized protein (DUF736 family)
MPEIKKNDDELGALWIKTSARGEYMTGTINGQPVVLFRNDRKAAGSNQPDWRVLKSKPKGERTVGADDAMPF